jgi:D-apionolactonase
MRKSIVTKNVILCGTEQPDLLGRILKTGPLEVEFDNGQLRYIKIHGIEVLRAIGFLVRDENWGTYIPKIKNLNFIENSLGFSISFTATCTRPGQEISYEAVIKGSKSGNLTFSGIATPKNDFLTARTGFVVLHPLKGIANKPVDVKHVNGVMERAKFPNEVNPVQPFLRVRTLTHEVLPGLKARVNFDGDTFEMEDHRNWTDASFKTYVRPLALPWPYTLKAGERVEQSIRVTLEGRAKAKPKSKSNTAIKIKLGKATRRKLMPIGFGIPAEEIEHALKNIDLIKNASPKRLQCHFDPRENHGIKELIGYRKLAEATGAKITLEIVVKSLTGYAKELRQTAKLVAKSGLKLDDVAVCPVGDLKSVLPGSKRPPAPPLANLYRAARLAFPGAKVGGGMFSFFTELNRKRPPAKQMDFAMNATCPIVHAADDRSVMETLEALPYQISTAKKFLGKTPHTIGPTAIGCRDNPHGASFTPNPKNERLCLVKADPRTRGLFGAAWLVGYIGTLAHADVQSLTIGSATGPLGVIHRRYGGIQPYFNKLNTHAVYPAYHVATSFMNSVGRSIIAIENADSQRVYAFGVIDKAGKCTIWLANLTREQQTVSLMGIPGMLVGMSINENNFKLATQHPYRLQGQWKSMEKTVTLKPYAVSILSST